MTRVEPWRRRFRQRFERLRTSEGLTQERLGARLNVTQGTIAHWLHGRRSPDNIAQFQALEAALGLSPGDLLREDQVERPCYVAAIMDVDAVAAILEGMEHAREGGTLPLGPRAQAEVFCQAYQRWVLEGASSSVDDSDAAAERKARRSTR